jgi:hypothetical protein
MKTPMQEHIEWLDIQWGNAKDCGEKTIDFEIAMKHAEQMLEKEKEVMCEFAEEYVGSCLIDYPKIKIIFDQTFNN